MPAITRGFAWARRSLGGEPEIASVTRQGIWVLVGLIGVSVLGFGFWWLAARLFSHDDVGVAASLVSLSTFGAALAVLGFDAGIMRFAFRELHPRRLIRTILLVTGLLAGCIGIVLPVAVLTINHVNSGLLWPLTGLGLALTVWTVWIFATNGALIAASKAQLASLLMLLYGGVKIGFLVVFVSIGVVGLVAAYTLPLAVIVLIGFLLIPRHWPSTNPQGTAHSLREVATLSGGNWISYFGYALPNMSGPALILTFFGPSAALYFFLAFQLAEVLNYGAEGLSKSLLSHGSREDRLSRALTSRVRARVLMVLLPLVAAGILAAPSVGFLVGGPGLSGHALFIQLFLLATIPRSSYQLLQAQFNVDRRPVAVAACGATFGFLTFGGLLLGLLLRVPEDFLPGAWIVGGTGALFVGLYLMRRTPHLATASPSPP